MKRILVTGATGFVGGHLTRTLANNGYSVNALCRRPDEKLNHPNIHLIAGDLADATALVTACHGVDTVFHVAALAGDGRDRERYLQVNLKGTEHLLSACQQQGVARLIYTSSPSVIMADAAIVDGDESLPYPKRFLNPYSESKALAEQLVLSSNNQQLSTCALRPHAIFGPGDRNLLPRLLQRHRAGRLRIIGDGNNRISICYIESCVQAHIQAALAACHGNAVAGQAYFINEPNPVVLWPWLNDIFKQLALAPVQRHIPLNIALLLGKAMDAVYQQFPGLGEPALSGYLCQLLGKDHFFSTAKANRDFGFEPVIPLQQAVSATLSELTV